MGSPLVDADITPLPEVGKVEAMQAYIDEAVEKGASVINGRGGTVEGNMMFPAILYPVDRDTAIFKRSSLVRFVLCWNLTTSTTCSRTSQKATTGSK